MNLYMVPKFGISVSHLSLNGCSSVWTLCNRIPLCPLCCLQGSTLNALRELYLVAGYDIVHMVGKR